MRTDTGVLRWDEIHTLCLPYGFVLKNDTIKGKEYSWNTISFATHEEANATLTALNGVKYGDSTLTVEWRGAVRIYAPPPVIAVDEVPSVVQARVLLSAAERAARERQCPGVHAAEEAEEAELYEAQMLEQYEDERKQADFMEWQVGGY